MMENPILRERMRNRGKGGRRRKRERNEKNGGKEKKRRKKEEMRERNGQSRPDPQC